MDSRLSKIESFKRKKQVLYSICIGFAFFVLLFFYTKITDSSACLVNNLFGVKCIGCGMTRGFISILKLDFKSAIEYNILSIPLFIAIILYVCLAVADIMFNKNYVYLIEEKIFRKSYLIILGIIVIFSYYLNN